MLAPPELTIDYREVRELTANSPRVYFLSSWDCLYYYEGDYVPAGHFTPYTAWIFKKDLIAFLNDLLDKGYFLVWDGSVDISELMPTMGYNKYVQSRRFLVLWKQADEGSAGREDSRTGREASAGRLPTFVGDKEAGNGSRRNAGREFESEPGGGGAS